MSPGIDCDEYAERLSRMSLDHLLAEAARVGGRYAAAKQVIRDDGPLLRALVAEMARRRRAGTRLTVADILRAIQHAFERSWVDQIINAVQKGYRP